MNIGLPPEPAEYCFAHSSWDTNGDGLCIKYATAQPQAKDYLGPCSMTPVRELG